MRERSQATLKVPLRIRKRYFDMIVKGDKRVEYRRDSDFWWKRLGFLKSGINYGIYNGIAVFVCGKRVHRREITKIDFIRTPQGFSEQGKKDVDTVCCFAIHLGETVEK